MLKRINLILIAGGFLTLTAAVVIQFAYIKVSFIDEYSVLSILGGGILFTFVLIIINVSFRSVDAISRRFFKRHASKATRIMYWACIVVPCVAMFSIPVTMFAYAIQIDLRPVTEPDLHGEFIFSGLYEDSSLVLQGEGMCEYIIRYSNGKS